ncbi:hypothetical protein OAQ62_01810 [bacterium]|nr:hypothetical protein [bacterium]
MATSDDANLKVIVSRIQQRRGLKQELPQPLRPGEIGFATDSRQVYIGADTDDATSKTYNKTVVFETTQNAQDLTKSLANSQIIKFEVPHIRFPKGSGNFNSATKQISWNPSTSSTYIKSDGTNNTRTNFGSDVIGNSSVVINQNISNNPFKAENLTVIVNGKELKGDADGSGATVNAAFDYNFISGNSLSSDHILNFRTAPANSEDVSISYYGNTQIIHLLTSNTIVTSGATISGFYTAKGIEEWQQLNHENILVNAETGTGYIGLESKHIDVVGLGSAVSNIANVIVGTVIAAKNPNDVGLYGGNSSYDASTYAGNFVTSTVGATTITFQSGTTVLGLAHQGNVSNDNGSQEYVYFEGLNAAGVTEAGYLHKKILPVKNTTDVSTSTFICDMPANATSTARAVTATFAGTTVTVTGNTAGLSDGAYVEFIGSNATEFNDAGPYVISNTGTTSFQVTETLTSNKTNNLEVIPYNDSSKTNVIMHSGDNGLANAGVIQFDGAVGTINASTNTSVSNVTTNSFEVASGDLSANVTVNFSPVLTNITGNVGVTPGVTLKLAPVSGDKTLNSAIADINASGNWVKASLVPNSTNTTYITSSDQTEYVLFNEPNSGIETWGNIGINLNLATDHKYTKADNTVKAKFEDWLVTLFTAQNHKSNILSNVFINNQFTTTSFGTYDLDINSTTGEIDFDGYEEAGNFAEIINKLYFEKTNSNIKGLATIKTNIELLTNEATASSSATADYSEPNTISLETANSPNAVSSLGTDSSLIDTLFIDYVMDARFSGGLYYNKVGTLKYTANPFANGGSGSVVVQDSGTEFSDTGVTVNDGITFTGGISSGTVTISSNCSLSPTPSNVTMKYITRRWKSF